MRGGARQKDGYKFMATLRIVYFPHSAKEFIAVDTKTGRYVPCNWNTAKHRRRLVIHRGDYIDRHNILQSTDLVFWTEWEGNTLVKQFLLPTTVTSDAKFVHKPLYPSPCRPVSQKNRCCMNTDPCVFGRSFKYAFCRQLRDNNPTVLQDLAPGSLIVFGGVLDSTNGNDREFYLDTVFVVGNENQKYTGPDRQRSVRCSKAYRILTLDQTVGTLTFYRGVSGASLEASSRVMYSFTPAQCADSDGLDRSQRLRRRCPLDLTRLNSIVNGSPKQIFNVNNMSSFCSMEVPSPSVVQKVWDELLKQIRQKGFVPAVHFDWPEEKGAQISL